ncbi:MAG: hypothetical protein ACRD0A_16175 [Acidimicrobiales bacterium]
MVAHHQAPADRHDAGVEVDVAPAQGEQLGLASPRGGGQPQVGGQAGVGLVGEGQGPVDGGDRRHLGLGFLLAGPLGPRRRVVGQQRRVLAGGLSEGGVQDLVGLVGGARAGAAADLGIEQVELRGGEPVGAPVADGRDDVVAPHRPVAGQGVG